jgi:mono/diheme cytochrome c family protein
MIRKTTPNIGLVGRLRAKLPLFLVLAVVAGGVWVFITEATKKAPSTAVVQVTVPTLSEIGRQGEQAFNDNCAACHGENAAGGDGGPPLVHNIYVPGHHGDGSFRLAFQRGVRQHHWRFGDMPPQPQIGNETAAAIIRYVRELQVANGIGTR